VSRVAEGLVLALAASVALNAGFLFQHAGSRSSIAISPRHPVATLSSLLRSPLWAAGTALGLAGWAMHVGALARAPLSLVQAFVAGGLALAAPMAVVALRVRLTRVEVWAIALMVCALVALTAGLDAHGSAAHFDAARLGVYTGALAAAAAALAARVGGDVRAAALGVAGGLLYGAADLAIKALAGGGAALASPWLVVAGVATAGAFFAFQRGLQIGRPLVVIALMTAATNVSSVAGGFVVFGDELGRTAPLSALHLTAFCLIFVAAWLLAPVQAAMQAA
jgi:hypothetical protein